MKDNKFLHETIKRFGDGLDKAMSTGGDTFSFEFDANELSGVKEDKSIMTLVVLLRPKDIADPMLEAMQAAREHMLAEAEKAAKGAKETVKP